MKLRGRYCTHAGVTVRVEKIGAFLITVASCTAMLLILNNMNTIKNTPLKDPYRATSAYTPGKLYISRLLKAQDFCFRSKPGGVRRVMVDNKKSLANCVIPKAGCTFWINIFRFIKNETHGKVYESPFHIPRWITHYGNRSAEYFIRNGMKAPTFLKDAFRFVFVRDPYRRLWASWIDKFLLPDFWLEVGKMIAAERRLGERAGHCHSNISFVDFLQFVTSDYFFKHPEDLDEHWAPIHELCDPCIFRPHFIGKMETFEEDSNSVLAKTNLSWVKELSLPQNLPMQRIQAGQNKHSSDDTQFTSMTGRETRPPIGHSMTQLKTSDEQILHEMEIITDYIFNWVWKHSLRIEQCASKYFIAMRLWQAFQYNGYIPKDSTLNLNSGSRAVNPDTLKVALLEAYSKWDKTYTKRRHAQREQKRKAMQAAYRLVPLSVMEKLQNIYMNDFEQFGYDPEPEALFQRAPLTESEP